MFSLNLKSMSCVTMCYWPFNSSTSVILIFTAELLMTNLLSNINMFLLCDKIYNLPIGENFFSNKRKTEHKANKIVSAKFKVESFVLNTQIIYWPHTKTTFCMLMHKAPCDWLSAPVIHE